MYYTYRILPLTNADRQGHLCMGWRTASCLESEQVGWLGASAPCTVGQSDGKAHAKLWGRQRRQGLLWVSAAFPSDLGLEGRHSQASN